MKWPWEPPDPVVIRPELREILTPVAPYFKEQASSAEQGDALVALKELLREAGLLGE